MISKLQSKLIVHSILCLFTGEYCRMGDKDGKQVLMCSWGHKSDPALGMDFTHKQGETTEKVLEEMIQVGQCETS